MSTVEAQVMEATPKPTPVALKATDRCDRCGAQAFVRTKHPTTTGRVLPLDWCGHHFNANREHLEGLVVIDQRAAMNRGCAAG